MIAFYKFLYFQDFLSCLVLMIVLSRNFQDHGKNQEFLNILKVFEICKTEKMLMTIFDKNNVQYGTYFNARQKIIPQEIFKTRQDRMC